MKRKHARGGRRSSASSFHSNPHQDLAFERKTRQLCRQIHEQIDLVLGDFDDPRLQALWVAEVGTTPFGSALQVTLVVPDDAELPELRARLDAAHGRIRSEVAGAIHRKRTPQLRFALIPERAFTLQGGEVEHD